MDEDVRIAATEAVATGVVGTEVVDTDEERRLRAMILYPLPLAEAYTLHAPFLTYLLDLYPSSATEIRGQGIDFHLHTKALRVCQLRAFDKMNELLYKYQKLDFRRLS